jgi:hypothetical protein
MRGGARNNNVNIFVFKCPFCETHSHNSAEGSVVSLSAFAYIYSELVQYHQQRAASISELERRLESAGYGVGLKVLEMTAYRAKEVNDESCAE